MTYGELFSRFTQQHPEIAVDDYRPAPGAYALTIWEKETHTPCVTGQTAASSPSNWLKSVREEA